MSAARLWVAIGFGGQLLFMLRFLVQWVQSERLGRSVTPAAFWWFSVGGGVTLLLYAIHRRDPVFILGQSTGLFVYARNLQLVARERRASRAREPGGAADRGAPAMG